ncbi:MAG: C39 family peptidase [Gammaproteobacteria bacterium]
MKACLALVLMILLGACAQLPQAPHSNAEAGQRDSAWLNWRFADITPQRYSSSCGAAAVSTVVSYHCGLPLSERQVLDEIASMRRAANGSTDFSAGVSMLDMLRVLRQRGFQVRGLAGDPSGYLAPGRPVIALIERRGIRHFTVLTGIHRGRVWLADSLDGNTSLSWAEFQSLRDGADYFIAFERSCAMS